MSFTWSYHAVKDDDVFVVNERHDCDSGVYYGEASLMAETKEELVEVLIQAANDIEAQIKAEGETK
jgi:hypothetical protein